MSYLESPLLLFAFTKSYQILGKNDHYVLITRYHSTRSRSLLNNHVLYENGLLTRLVKGKTVSLVPSGYSICMRKLSLGALVRKGASNQNLSRN